MVLAITLGACHGSPAVPPPPAPDPEPVHELIPDLLAESFSSDSAADEAALTALRDLQFRSLSKGGERVRGVFAPPDTLGRVVNRTPPRGGTASAADFDLDIESFLGDRRVRYYRDYFLGPARNRFNIWLGRLNRYEGMIENVFRRYGLPEDLVYLALIESGYSNTAVSRASAVGMWQFMAATGRRYGLRIDGWVDERRDPFKATDAAARHLADLEDEFGAWYLAAAAYNAGSTRVSRGLRRLRNEIRSDKTFFALSDRRYLRRETRDYVPKLIASTVIAKDPPRHGFSDIPKLEPLVFDEITVPSQTGLDVLADLADTTDAAIVELNPHYYRGATPPGERSVVRVPRGSGPAVLERYATLPASERVNYIEHRVRRGETLGEIAQRYGVRARDLTTANPGVRPRRLRIGQRLVVPVSTRAREITRSGGPVRASAASRTGIHRVRTGESLWSISKRYRVSVRDLRRWNGIPANSSVLKPGQRLRIAPG